MAATAAARARGVIAGDMDAGAPILGSWRALARRTPHAGLKPGDYVRQDECLPGQEAWPAPGQARGSARRFKVTLASIADDRDIARLLRETEFPGDVRLSLEREPSPLAAGAIEGDVHQVIVARDSEDGRVAGIASRSVRDAFVNGAVARVGYLGQLRVVPSSRRLRSLMDEGFTFLRALHDEGDAPFYLASVVSDNDAARRLLDRRWSRAAPRFVPIETLRTFAIPVTAGSLGGRGFRPGGPGERSRRPRRSRWPRRG